MQIMHEKRRSKSVAATQRKSVWRERRRLPRQNETNTEKMALKGGDDSASERTHEGRVFRTADEGLPREEIGL